MCRRPPPQQSTTLAPPQHISPSRHSGSAHARKHTLTQTWKKKKSMCHTPETRPCIHPSTGSPRPRPTSLLSALSAGRVGGSSSFPRSPEAEARSVLHLGASRARNPLTVLVLERARPVCVLCLPPPLSRPTNSVRLYLTCPLRSRSL